MPQDDNTPINRADLDRVVELIAAEISRTREEITHRLEGVTIHLDRVDTRLAGLEHQMGGIQRWMSATEKLQAEILATQAAQRRAFDALAGRVDRLEKAS